MKPINELHHWLAFWFYVKMLRANVMLMKLSYKTTWKLVWEPYNHNMHKRFISTILACVFLFILTMTSWDYCPPKPGHHNQISSVSSVLSVHVKNAHQPCASLKDIYDILPTIIGNFKTQTAKLLTAFPSLSHSSFLNDHLCKNDLSPPLATSPPQSIPLFQLNCNLRI